jgi:hypothetical protein
MMVSLFTIRAASVPLSFPAASISVIFSLFWFYFSAMRPSL